MQGFCVIGENMEVEQQKDVVALQMCIEENGKKVVKFESASKKAIEAYKLDE